MLLRDILTLAWCVQGPALRPSVADCWGVSPIPASVHASHLLLPLPRRGSRRRSCRRCSTGRRRPGNPTRSGNLTSCCAACARILLGFDIVNSVPYQIDSGAELLDPMRLQSLLLEHRYCICLAIMLHSGAHAYETGPSRPICSLAFEYSRLNLEPVLGCSYDLYFSCPCKPSNLL